MKKELISTAIIALVLTAGCIIYFKLTTEKTAYVNINELYNEFQMKKELEANFLAIEKGRKTQLDSLEIELKMLNRKLETNLSGNKDLIDVFESKRETYLLKKQQFEEDNALMQQTYTSDIMKQLNQYVSDYGKEKGLGYIFGGEGSGAIMYAEQKNDITNEVKQYINNKFKGLK